MQMDRPTLTGLEQDVHLIFKDFEQFSKPDERVLGARPQTAPMGGGGFLFLYGICSLKSNAAVAVEKCLVFCLGCYVQCYSGTTSFFFVILV